MLSVEKIIFFNEILSAEEDEDLLFTTIIMRNPISEMFHNRKAEGAYEILVKRHLFTNEIKFREYFRLSTNLFYFVLNHIKADLTVAPCNRVSDPISAEEKLCVTLKFLATGISLRSLAFDYRISHSYLSHIVATVVKAINTHLLQEAIPSPSESSLIKSEEDFRNLWNFPNCVGAVDGKHVRIRCPDNSGTINFNYKEYFSIVLFAMVDAQYRFLAIDIGSYGKEGDASILRKSMLGKMLEQNQFPMPGRQNLPNSTTELPHVILGDEAFALTTYMMRPYSRDQARAHNDLQKAIYNYRHCRARRVVENAFGILSQYFRIFHTPIDLGLETVNQVVITACILHNLLRREQIPSYPTEANDLNARDPRILRPNKPTNLISLRPIGYNASRDAFAIRDAFAAYFCSENGEVPWQTAYVLRDS